MTSTSLTRRRVALFGLLPIASALTVSPTTHFASPQIALSLRPATAAVGAPHAATALLLSHAAISARARAIQMFEGPPPEPEDEDVWEEIANEMTKTQKVLKGLHPIAMGTANNAIVVLAALTAWFLMPPAAPVVVTSVPVVGSGFLGRRFGKRLNRLRSETAPASVAEVVAAALNLKSLDPDDVERVAERYGLDPDEFQRVLSTVYGRYLRSVVAEDDAVDTRQVTQLAQLRRGLGLGWNGTVTAHNGEATTLTGGTPPPKGQTPPEAQRLLWLTAILFGASKGQASAADLQATLGLDADEAAEVVGELSSPLYRKAVSRAVAKFNLTEAPDALQKARATLQLGEDSSARIHSQMYDAQLGMLLEGDGAGLDDSALALLGELEAMLQLRGSSGLMQARTVPMYRAAAASELRALLDGKTGASVWGSMAVRQQQLSLPSDRSKPVVVEEARRIALEQLAAAATAQAAGRTDEAQATLQKLLSYASAYGTMLQAAAWEADSANPDDLAAQYLGALTLDEALEAPARALAEATSGDTLKAMLARYLAEYDGAPPPRPRSAPNRCAAPHPTRRSPALALPARRPLKGVRRPARRAHLERRVRGRRRALVAGQARRARRRPRAAGGAAPAPLARHVLHVAARPHREDGRRPAREGRRPARLPPALRLVARRAVHRDRDRRARPRQGRRELRRRQPAQTPHRRPARPPHLPRGRTAGETRLRRPRRRPQLSLGVDRSK